MNIQRILIVSGDLSRAIGLEASLQRYFQDCQVALATNGLAALNRLRERAYDIILADYELPRMSGFDLALAASHDSPQSKVILMADRSEAEGAPGATHAPNVKSVLMRPLDIFQLWSIVQTPTARHSE